MVSVSGKSFGVIGGGIAGLASALALAHRGGKVVVFEQADAFEEVGAGLQISANGVRVLEALGLDLIEANQLNMPTKVRLCDYKRGTEIASLPLNSNSESPFLQLHRADLLENLRQSCEKAGVTLKTGSEMTVPQGADSEKFDLWVAADGVRSGTRAQLFAGHKPQFTGQVAWRALVPLGNNSIDWPERETRLYLGPHRHVVVYPLRDHTVLNIVAIEERDEWTAEGWNHQDTQSNLLSTFQGWSDELATLLGHAGDPLIWGLFAHATLANWSNGNVVLVGDAAHPMLPFMAQGACAALEDAFVLARSLHDTDDLNEGLKIYEAVRKPRATRVQQVSRGNAEIYHAANPLLRFGLHTGMRLSSRFLPSLMTRRYDWIYDHDVTKGQLA